MIISTGNFNDKAQITDSMRFTGSLMAFEGFTAKNNFFFSVNRGENPISPNRVWVASRFLVISLV